MARQRSSSEHIRKLKELKDKLRRNIAATARGQKEQDELIEQIAIVQPLAQYDQEILDELSDCIDPADMAWILKDVDIHYTPENNEKEIVTDDEWATMFPTQADWSDKY